MPIFLSLVVLEGLTSAGLDAHKIQISKRRRIVG
jgi:hypothetical protein